MNLEQIAESCLQQLKALGADDAQVEVSSSIMTESNVEANNINFVRTTHDHSLSIQAFKDKRKGAVSGNQLDADSIKKLCEAAMQSANSAPQDDGNVLPEGQGEHSFIGSQEPKDLDWALSQLDQILQIRKEKYPHAVFGGGVLSHVEGQKVLFSSKGSRLKSKDSFYTGGAFISGKDGKKSSSFSGTDYETKKTSTPIYTQYGFEALMREAVEQLNVDKLPQKFVGDVVMTPHCMGEFLGFILGYISTQSLLKKKSFLYGKLGEKVASEKFTLTANPKSPKFVRQLGWTGDGIISQNEPIFEKGVLKQYLVNQYGAKKLGFDVSKSGGAHVEIQTGDKSLNEMISKIDKGIIMGRVSAGHPAENGDFSGVAKNAYYVEGGKIKYPLTETMVAGNLAELLKNVVDISKESINFGNADLPWVQFKGITIS
jgi:PmbA protein